LGFSSSRISKKSNYQSIIVLLLMLSGYFMVYIITPHDLNWHLNTSLERLFLQLLPSVIFIFFMNLNNIEVITKTKIESIKTR
jgi:putative copper export protein